MTDTVDLTLTAAAQYILGLQQVAQEAEDIERSNEEWDEASAALLNFTWLCAKFETFWFEDTTTEAYVITKMSSSVLFTPVDFERLVQSVLWLIEENFYRETSLTGDGGIDLVFRECLDHNWGAYAVTLIQCKLYRGFVPVSHVRDFFGVISAHTAAGIFVTTGRLTAQTRSFLPLANSSPHTNSLSVLDGSAWKKLLNLAKQCYEILVLLSDTDDESRRDHIVAELRSSQHNAKAILSACVSGEQSSLF